MQTLISSIIALSASIFSMASSYGAYNNYLMNREKYINEMISDSVEYAYSSYVKKAKENNQWNAESKNMALDIAKTYFMENSLYKIPDIRLRRKIQYKLLEIKSIKSNNQLK